MVMTRGGDAFETTVSLRAGRSYRFKYLVEGKRCENAWDTDDHLANEYGGTDSVIDVPARVDTERWHESPPRRRHFRLSRRSGPPAQRWTRCPRSRAQCR